MDVMIDYYISAYGPTIRLDVGSLNDLRDVIGILSGLATGGCGEIQVHRVRGFRVTNLDSLTMAVVGGAADIGVRRVGHLDFIWRDTSDGWDRCCGLIDGMLQAKKPCHQYFGDDGCGDAIVEICMMEGGLSKT